MDYEKAYKDLIAKVKKEQNPAKWSEEDETFVKDAIDAVENYYSKGCGQEELVTWLKSLPERFNLQPKQEWSEEDEKMMSDIIGVFDGRVSIYTLPVKQYANRLKSLRPQPHKEIYQTAKHDLAIRFMNYLDENRPEGKRSLSNGECEDIDKAFKENDWAKILRYAEKYGKEN